MSGRFPHVGDAAEVLLEAPEQLRELRAALPRRPLQVAEGLILAERQAWLLRWQLGYGVRTAMPTEVLRRLPFLIEVSFHADLARSGLATKTKVGWAIVLHAGEPRVRRRFSLAHEIKHVLDDALLAELHGALYRAGGGFTAARRAEQVCDHFAACLLMPKLNLRRDWTSGMQLGTQLARRYDVSAQAMQIRLEHLGLVEPVARCGTAAVYATSPHARA
jgi:Zn-dependent peptidase ImmA (M78 family)